MNCDNIPQIILLENFNILHLCISILFTGYSILQYNVFSNTKCDYGKPLSLESFMNYYKKTITEMKT